jgi:hypothetical protein
MTVTFSGSNAVVAFVEAVECVAGAGWPEDWVGDLLPLSMCSACAILSSMAGMVASIGGALSFAGALLWCGWCGCGNRLLGCTKTRVRNRGALLYHGVEGETGKG